MSSYVRYNTTINGGVTYPEAFETLSDVLGDEEDDAAMFKA